MTHTVAVGEFEGPLGILLELVERGKLEVTEISVARITSEYLERIQTMHRSPEDLTEFVQLGARLLYIKSLALLPPDSAEERTEELRLLNLELAEYRQMQAAAQELARHLTRRTWPRTVTERLAPHELPLPTVELPELASAFSRALARTEPVQPTGIIQSHISLETMTKRLRTHLADGKFDLDTILVSCRDRLEIIVAFLALLELIHLGAAAVVQSGQFAPISIEAARG